jgi:hypothetical protein
MGKTITLSDEAYEALERLKTPEDNSFSKVVLRRLRAPADTAGELLDRFERLPAPEFDEQRAARVMAERGRRSPRP